MSKVADTAPKGKKERYVRLLRDFSNGPAKILIKERKNKTEFTEDVYIVYRSCNQDAEAYIFAKVGGPDSVYKVYVANDQDHQCDCPGHGYRGECRHVLSLFALRAQGKI